MVLHKVKVLFEYINTLNWRLTIAMWEVLIIIIIINFDIGTFIRRDCPPKS